MKILSSDIHAKVYLYLFQILAFVLPIHERLVSPVIILIGLNWLLELNFREKFRRIRGSRKNRLLMLFTLIYLPYLAGFYYSDNFTGWSGAWFALEVKLSLVVFPLLFATIVPESIDPRFYNKILKAFISGCIASSIIIINLAIFHYFKEGTSSVFFYSRLSDPFHPSYLSLYYSFAMAILLYWLIRNYSSNQTKTVFVILLIFYFQLLTIFLSSKAGIIGVFIVCLLLILYALIKIKKSGWLPVGTLLAFAAIYFFILIITPPALSRFVAVKGVMEQEEKGQINTDTDESTASRVLIWKSSWEVIREHPLWGVGTGDVKQAVLKKYREKHITLAYQKGLNAHNQFLQTWMATGLPGLILLLLSFAVPAWYAFRKGKIIYLIFIALMVFHNLVESMLERQAGVVFYGFMNALLFYYSFRSEDQELPANSRK